MSLSRYEAAFESFTRKRYPFFNRLGYFEEVEKKKKGNRKNNGTWQKTWAGYNENEKKDEYEAVEEIVDEEIVDMVETEDLATMNDEAKESDTSAGSTRKLFGF